MSYKKITKETVLSPGMKIRELNKNSGEYDCYTIGQDFVSKDSCQVHPNNENYLNKGVLLEYPRAKMIARGCEYEED